jgi:hypothetical protein
MSRPSPVAAFVCFRPRNEVSWIKPAIAQAKVAVSDRYEQAKSPTIESHAAIGFPSEKARKSLSSFP